jgi:hypothetical protein
MSTNPSTRRSFLKGGVLLAAPLAAAAPADGLEARLARLEDEAAIRELNRAWLRHVNSGAGEKAAALYADPAAARLGERVRSLGADPHGELETIEVAADGTATARLHCTVETETEIPRDCTPARMAHEQGGGFVRRAERRTLEASYVKSAAGWKIAKLRLAPA